MNRSKILREAERFTHQGKIEQAIARFKILLKDNPRDVSTVNKVGDLYARIGKIPEAVRQFLATAEFYATDGFLLKAIAIYKKVTKLAPENLDAVLKLGDLYDQQGLPMEAKTQYRGIADRLVKSGNMDRARDVLGRILKIDPADVRTRIQVADLQLQQGKMEEAVAEYQQVGEELRKLGKSEEYEKILEKALQADPTQGVVARSLARLYCEKGEAPRAVSLARKVADARPEDEDAVVLLAETYLHAGSPAEAEQILDQAPAALMQGSADLQALRGRVRLAQGNFDGAAEPILTAVAAFRSSERAEAAIGLLQEWVQTRPGCIDALESLHRLHLERGEISLAATAALQLADALRQAGRSTEAVPVLEAILKQDADNERIQAALAAVQGGSAPPPAAAADAPDGVIDIVVDLDATAEPAPPVPSAPEPVPAVPTAASPPAPAAPANNAGSAEIAGEDFEGYYADSGDNLMDAQVDVVEEEVEDQEFIQEHLTESEVFLKYRLIEKAEERLQDVLRRYPRNLAANERLRSLYLEERDRDKLTRQTLRVADIHDKNQDSDQAIECLVQALRAVPDESDLMQRLRDLGVNDPAELLVENFSLGGEKTAVPSAAPIDPAPFDNATGGDDLEIELDLDDGTPEESSGDATAPLAPAAPVAAAEVAEPERPLNERLREVDFFMEQELWDEARGLLEVMRIQEGDHTEVEQRWQELEERQAAGESPAAVSEEDSDIAMEVDRALGGAPPAPVAKKVAVAPKIAAAEPKKAAAAPKKTAATAKPAAGDSFFDLGSELLKELEQAEQNTPEEEELLQGVDVSQEGHSVDELFQAFRKGVEEQVDKGDFETHYQLGIAYKEMGLLDEAIGEFQYAAKDSKLFLDCCSILGLCFKEKGMIPLSIGWYQKALKTPGFEDEDYLGVRYDLSLVLVDAGKKDEALKLLMEVYGENSNYRDVAAVIKKLQKS